MKNYSEAIGVILLIVLSISVVAQREGKATAEKTNVLVEETALLEPMKEEMLEERDASDQEKIFLRAVATSLSPEQQEDIVKTVKEVNEENILELIVAKAKVMQDVE